MRAILFGGPFHGDVRDLPVSCWELRLPIPAPPHLGIIDSDPPPQGRDAVYQRMKAIDVAGFPISAADASLLIEIAMGNACPFVYVDLF